MFPVGSTGFAQAFLEPRGWAQGLAPYHKGTVLEVSASFPWYTQTIVLISHSLRTKDLRVWTSMLTYFLCFFLAGYCYTYIQLILNVLNLSIDLFPLFFPSRLLLYRYSIISKGFKFINFRFAFSFKKSIFRLWKVFLEVQANTRQDVSLEYNSSSFNFNIHVPFAHPPPFRLINKPLPFTACIWGVSPS